MVAISIAKVELSILWQSPAKPYSVFQKTTNNFWDSRLLCQSRTYGNTIQITKQNRHYHICRSDVLNEMHVIQCQQERPGQFETKRLIRHLWYGFIHFLFIFVKSVWSICPYFNLQDESLKYFVSTKEEVFFMMVKNMFSHCSNMIRERYSVFYNCKTFDSHYKLIRYNKNTTFLVN